jgi:uncharacterized membrane protein
MPSLGPLHPQIVHFVVALLFVGVIARLVSLAVVKVQGLRWVGPMALVLILIGTGAAALAVKSGMDAHGPVERVPGSRDAVTEHEELGELARTIFFVVAGIELVALALRKKSKVVLGLHVASVVVGTHGLYAVYEAAEHGGELVYSYAGGVGIRSGDTADVRRLLIAGLYHQAAAERRAERGTEAARLTDELALQMPGDMSVRMLQIESRLRDRGDAAGALAMLDSLAVPDSVPRMRLLVSALRVEALAAAGLADSARALLGRLKAEFPQSRRVAELEGQLGG